MYSAAIEFQSCPNAHMSHRLLTHVTPYDSFLNNAAKHQTWQTMEIAAANTPIAAYLLTHLNISFVLQQMINSSCVARPHIAENICKYTGTYLRSVLFHVVCL